ncbi:MAG: hypothetical protein PHU02_02315 [Bacilli bacterium]|nr:hypothetical protein [Bacilli bacterium]MDD2681496.1 hypothetical protein [Bacilli bacterium]MDD3121576.1 hypothetical protein [Bacilli bacterium]MDD4062935.1 hypothetical protein [Bacilli bacterium]MDD4482293.1 hypothetical protein [Bacilli bacterium]
MCIFKWCKRKKKDKFKHKQVEAVISKDKPTPLVFKNDDLPFEEKKDITVLKDAIDISNDDEIEDIDTSKDYERVMARNAAVKIIQADLDMRNNNKLLDSKSSRKDPESDKKKNFEDLFKKNK